MEAKVDIRKLQLLNDRIAQTIEALNQVRLSVHGLQHTGAYGAQGVGMPGLGGLGTVGQQQFVPGIGQVPYGAFQTLGQSPWGVGLQHTGAFPGLQAPWAPSPFVNPMLAGVGIGALGQTGIGQVPWGMGGLSHTSPEVEAMRYAQTFPYAFTAFSPVGFGAGINPWSSIGSIF
jgi:hypothetical protein